MCLCQHWELWSSGTLELDQFYVSSSLESTLSQLPLNVPSVNDSDTIIEVLSISSVPLGRHVVIMSTRSMAPQAILSIVSIISVYS